MNTQDVIHYIVTNLPQDITGEKRDPQNWVQSVSVPIVQNGITYIRECYQCMENFGLAPAGLIVTVFLDAAHDQVLRMIVQDLTAEVDQYARMVETFYGPLDNLRK